MRSLDRKRKLTPKTLPGILKCVNSSKSSILSLFSLYFISSLCLFYLYFISMAGRWMAGRLAGPWLVGWLAGWPAGWLCFRICGIYPSAAAGQARPRTLAILSPASQNQTLGSARGAKACQETYMYLNSPAKSNVRMHSPPSVGPNERRGSAKNL